MLCDYTKFAIDSLQALDELRRDDKITISPADKKRMTVVMDTGTYEGKAHALLNDSSMLSLTSILWNVTKPS